MRRILLVVSAAVAMTLVLLGPAAAQYPPLPEEGVDVAVSDATLLPGEPFTVTGDGWLPGSTVTFTLFSEPVVLGSAAVEDDTTFSARLEIPENTAPGTHTLEISGTNDDGQPRVAELTLEVLGTAANASHLASTGANPTAGLGLAAALLVAGGITLSVARRRRSRVLINS